MAAYTLKVRRFQPESGEGPYWESFDVDLDPTLSVLDGLLQAKDRDDGSLSVRCSCRAAICGSCGIKINGQSGLACKTQIGEAQEWAEREKQGREHHNGASASPASASQAAGSKGEAEQPAEIVVEPMGNMPVIKDLVTDMESTHWTKIRRVTPWLLPEGDPPEREYIVPPESMIDVTQTMACIQCGACVSSCLSMEMDPDFIGPAALAKAYRFVGDPRDAQSEERLHDLANDPHGIYDCTHCFSCIDACPKGVAPMDQIMRLRRAAGDEHGIEDVNNGQRHEAAFVKIIESKGTLDESLLLQESFAPGVKGKLKPPRGAIKALLESIPTAIRGLRSGKMRSLPKLIPGVHPKLPGDSQDHVKRIYAHAEEHSIELNLYIKGEEADEDAPVPEAEATPEAAVEPEPDETAVADDTGDAGSKGPTQGGEHGQADPGPSESGKPGQGGAA
ncbi:MAG: succinate dehydrogenase/fumarate reductase iron-sulfur subunit [Solirubrobacterales bacterium]